ncbi:MAG: tail fiber protein [Bacteroidota bacterium]
MEPFIGQIKMFAGNFAPKGWLFCHGQPLDTTTHSALYTILGITYGGDGRTFFNLPDLRGRIPIGPGQVNGRAESYQAGHLGGKEEESLSVQQIPSHHHQLSVTLYGHFEIDCSDEQGDQQSPARNYPAVGAQAPKLYGFPSAPNHFASMAQDALTIQVDAEVNLADAGGSESHTNMAPFQSINFIICNVGIYPTKP